MTEHALAEIADEIERLLARAVQSGQRWADAKVGSPEEERAASTMRGTDQDIVSLLIGNRTAILAALRRPEPAAAVLTALRAVMGLSSVQTLFEAAEEYPHGQEDVAAELSALNLARAALAAAQEGVK